MEMKNIMGSREIYSYSENVLGKLPVKLCRGMHVGCIVGIISASTISLYLFICGSATSLIIDLQSLSACVNHTYYRFEAPPQNVKESQFTIQDKDN